MKVSSLHDKIHWPLAQLISHGPENSNLWIGNESRVSMVLGTIQIPSMGLDSTFKAEGTQVSTHIYSSCATQPAKLYHD